MRVASNLLGYRSGRIPAWPVRFSTPNGELDPGAWTHRPRLPLGRPLFRLMPLAVWWIFRAAGRASARAVQSRLRARPLRHFPVSSAADAVRFSVTDDRDGCLRVVYVFEKDHAPLSHGVTNEFTCAFTASWITSRTGQKNPKKTRRNSLPIFTECVVPFTIAIF